MRKRPAQTLSVWRRCRRALPHGVNALRCAAPTEIHRAGRAAPVGRRADSPVLAGLDAPPGFLPLPFVACGSSSGRCAPSGPSALRATPRYTGCAPPCGFGAGRWRDQAGRLTRLTGGRAFRGRRGSAPHRLTPPWGGWLPVGRPRLRLPRSPTPAAGASGDRRDCAAPAACPSAQFFWSQGFAVARPASKKLAPAPLHRFAVARCACRAVCDSERQNQNPTSLMRGKP